MSDITSTELREKLAEIEHVRWADWQKWCHKVLRENNPSPEIGDVLERWDRQIETSYADLTDREKTSDMEQVDRYWPLIEEYITFKVNQAREEQIMQDFLSLIDLPPNFEEQDLIEWRINQLNTLKKGME